RSYTLVPTRASSDSSSHTHTAISSIANSHCNSAVRPRRSALGIPSPPSSAHPQTPESFARHAHPATGPLVMVEITTADRSWRIFRSSSLAFSIRHGPSLVRQLPYVLQHPHIRRGMAIFGSSGSQTAPAGDSPFRVMVSPSSNTQILLFTEPALRREATSARASLDIG